MCPCSRLTSVASARVGRGARSMESNIWVAVTTNLPEIANPNINLRGFLIAIKQGPCHNLTPSCTIKMPLRLHLLMIIFLRRNREYASWCLSSWCWGVSTAVQTWTQFYSLLWLLWWVLRKLFKITDIISAAAALHQTDFLNVDFHAQVTTCKTKIIKHPSSTKNKCTQFHPQKSSLSCKTLAVKRMHPLSL